MVRSSFGEEGLGKPLQGLKESYQNRDLFRASALELNRNLMRSENLLLGVSGIYDQDRFLSLIDSIFKPNKIACKIH